MLQRTRTRISVAVSSDWHWKLNASKRLYIVWCFQKNRHHDLGFLCVFLVEANTLAMVIVICSWWLSFVPSFISKYCLEFGLTRISWFLFSLIITYVDWHFFFRHRYLTWRWYQVVENTILLCTRFKLSYLHTYYALL